MEAACSWRLPRATTSLKMVALYIKIERSQPKLCVVKSNNRFACQVHWDSCKHIHLGNLRSVIFCIGGLMEEADLLRNAFSLRRKICYKLEENRDEISAFIPGNFEAYIAYMSQDGVWGGELLSFKHWSSHLRSFSTFVHSWLSEEL